MADDVALNAITSSRIADGSVTKYGIYFRVTGNYFKEHVGSGNTTAAFGGTVPTGTADGGDNVSF